MVAAALAIGSNLGPRRRTIERAVTMIASDPDTAVGPRSRLLETAPVGGPPQGPYLNGAFLVETGREPFALLELLLEVETKLGRVRSVRNAPRTLDLDIILYRQMVLQTEELTIPHPRAHERIFVLEPLAEIAPDWIHPTLNKTISQLYAELQKRTHA